MAYRWITFSPAHYKMSDHLCGAFAKMAKCHAIEVFFCLENCHAIVVFVFPTVCQDFY